MAENDAPERIRLIRDNNGLFRSGWYYLDAAVGPHHSAIHYVRADIAAPDAAQWSSEIPKVNGFYWVQQGDHTPYIVEFEDGFAFFTGVERCSDHFSSDHRFLGPITPIKRD